VTNGFSKKARNLEAVVAPHFMFYYSCRIHGRLRLTPAMAAKATNRLCEIDDILDLPDSEERGSN